MVIVTIFFSFAWCGLFGGGEFKSLVTVIVDGDVAVNTVELLLLPFDKDSCQLAAAAEGTIADKTSSTKPDDSKSQSTSGIEDLFKDSPLLASSTVSEKPQKDAKNDIMSLFDKVSSTALSVGFSSTL